VNTIEVCSRLKETTYYIHAFTGQEPLSPGTTISEGSGVAINSSGDLLTAAHVVTGRIPVRPGDVIDPSVIILAKDRAGEIIQYIPVPAICGIALENYEHLRKPLTIDLALLRPLTPRKGIPHLRLNMQALKAGIQVVMAGFPDDMELPFSINRIVNKGNPEIQRLALHFELASKLLMTKSGMIGHTNEVVLTDGKLTLTGDIFYVDNVLHSGASGGPVVNMSAEVVGIITQRAITSVGFGEAPDLKVPSGSTVAVSPRIIQPHLVKETAGR